MTFEELLEKVEEIENRSRKPVKKAKRSFHQIGVYDALEESRKNVQKAYAKLNKLTMC